MAAYNNLNKYLGYGGEGQPLGLDINHQRTGLIFPPTHRKLLEYAPHLNSTYDGGGSYPKADLIK